VTLYWNDDDKKDQEFRREIGAGRAYMDSARCDWCKDPLNGSGSECEVCHCLLCSLDTCVDGRCPEHTNPGSVTSLDD
jgi:hypothetical protein